MLKVKQSVAGGGSEGGCDLAEQIPCIPGENRVLAEFCICLLPLIKSIVKNARVKAVLWYFVDAFLSVGCPLGAFLWCCGREGKRWDRLGSYRMGTFTELEMIGFACTSQPEYSLWFVCNIRLGFSPEAERQKVNILEYLF